MHLLRACFCVLFGRRVELTLTGPFTVLCPDVYKGPGIFIDLTLPPFNRPIYMLSPSALAEGNKSDNGLINMSALH